MTEHSEQQPPRADEAGSVSTPRDTAGDGPVGLEDRTEPGGQGSPDTNQAKAEPIPPTPGHRDPGAPLTPPTLDEMTVGAGDPQRPTLGAGLASASGAGAQGRTDLSGPGAAPAEERPAVSASSTGAGSGPADPLSRSEGVSHRAPGLQGEDSPAEQVETDVERSAEAMAQETGRPAGSGDTHGVPSVGQTSSEGTSEHHGVVQGARLPADG